MVYKNLKLSINDTSISVEDKLLEIYFNTKDSVSAVVPTTISSVYNKRFENLKMNISNAATQLKDIDDPNVSSIFKKRALEEFTSYMFNIVHNGIIMLNMMLDDKKLLEDNSDYEKFLDTLITAHIADESGTIDNEIIVSAHNVNLKEN